MDAPMSEKRYGLLLPKSKAPKVQAANIFGENENEDEGKAGVNASLGNQARKYKVKRQTQLDIDKALAEDPNVFEYDNVYDDMQERKIDKVKAGSNQVDRKSKYIGQLMKASETRKKEEERRTERIIQKERENEGDEFADKEVFVTTAYKKKMQEQAEEEERERRQAVMEARLDVTKQKDLSGFYRYILNETTSDIKVEPDENKPNETSSGGDRDGPSDGAALEQRPRSSTKGKQSPSPSSSSSSDSEEAPRIKSHHMSRSPERNRPSNRQTSRSPERLRTQQRDSKLAPDSYKSRSPDTCRPRSTQRENRDGSQNKYRSRSKDRKVRKRSPEDNRYHSKGKHSPHSRERYEDGDRDRRKGANSRKQRPNRSPEYEMKSSKENTKDKFESSDKKSRSLDRNSRSPKLKSKVRDTDDKFDSNTQSDNLVDRKVTNVSGAADESSKAVVGVKKKYARHTLAADVKDARARYLARKLALERAKSVGD